MTASRVLHFAMLAVASLALAESHNARVGDDPGIHRTVLIDEATAQVVRVIYDPGVVEPAKVHPFDVIIIPLNHGSIRLNRPGQADPVWEPGNAIFVKRGTEHRLANIGKSPVESVAVRIP